MACDICGKPSTSLTTLRDIYQTATIKMVCPSCESRVDKELDRIRARQPKELIAFMEREAQKPRLGRWLAYVCARTAGLD